MTLIFIIGFILGLCTAIPLVLLVVLVAKIYTKNINYILEKPVGETEIVGDSDEQSDVRANVEEADKNNLDIIIN